MVSRRWRETTGVVARVQQREAARAIGALEHARLEACLPDRRRLLVAGDAGNRQRGAEQGCGRGAEQGAAVLHLRQDRPRNAEEAQQIGVPVLAMDVVQHGARGVARVRGVHRAAREPPQQERIDGAERQLAALGRLARARDLVQQPGELGGREVGVDQEAGALPHQGVVTGGAQLATALRRCAGPARRSPGTPACRSPAPTAPRSRAGW